MMRHETDYPSPADLREFAREREREKNYKLPPPTPWRETIEAAFAGLIFGFFACAAVLASLMVLGFSFISSMLITVMALLALLAVWDTPR